MSDYLAARLQNLAPSAVCQGYFVGTAAVALLIQSLPADLRVSLLNYGARRPHDSTGSSTGGGGRRYAEALRRLVTRVVDATQVPHSWFLHYYVATVAWSAVWAWQFLGRGGLMGLLARLQVRNGEAGMELGQAVVMWALLALQGSKRLYESLCVIKPGKSPMGVLIWLIGLAYYTSMGTAVWIEGSGAILKHWQSPQAFKLLTPKLSAASVLFFYAWYNQYKCHRYLASLKKYTLPEDGAFKNIVCPHYSFECLLYTALTVAAAPPGKLVNKTVLSGLFFVVINLGITANGTKQWYAEKFGQDKVAKKWMMIPYLF